MTTNSAQGCCHSRTIASYTPPATQGARRLTTPANSNRARAQPRGSGRGRNHHPSPAADVVARESRPDRHLAHAVCLVRIHRVQFGVGPGGPRAYPPRRRSSPRPRAAATGAVRPKRLGSSRLQQTKAALVGAPSGGCQLASDARARERIRITSCSGLTDKLRSMGNWEPHHWPDHGG
jgi:hypothetical protein